MKKGFFLLAFLLSMFIGCLVSFACHAIVLGIVFFVGFAGTIVMLLIIVQVQAVVARNSMLRRIKESPLVDAEVLSCVKESEEKLGSYVCRPFHGKPVYHVRLKVNGSEKHAYTSAPFTAGEQVQVHVHPFHTSHATIDERPLF